MPSDDQAQMPEGTQDLVMHAALMMEDGGEVEMEAGETFWAPFFGVCKDRFGTPWMINAEAPEES